MCEVYMPLLLAYADNMHHAKSFNTLENIRFEPLCLDTFGACISCADIAMRQLFWPPLTQIS